MIQLEEKYYPNRTPYYEFWITTPDGKRHLAGKADYVDGGYKDMNWKNPRTARKAIEDMLTTKIKRKAREHKELLELYAFIENDEIRGDK